VAIEQSCQPMPLSWSSTMVARVLLMRYMNSTVDKSRV
jgi:hypothetical protein